MRRHPHSTIEKKPVNVIHTTVRSSNSLRTVSVTRHHRHAARKASIAPVVDNNLKKKINSISSIETDQANQYMSEAQQNITKTGYIIESSRQQPIQSSNSIKKEVKTNEKHNHENLSTSAKSSFKSIKMDQIQINTPNSKITPINDNNNAKTIDTQLNRTNPVNEHHRKLKLKHRRNYYCCSCSPLCAIASVIAVLLLAIAITAIIVALLTKTKATTTTIIVTTVTTTSTSTITSATSTSTTTETTTLPVLSIGSNDTLQGIWNTTAGGNSTLSTPGLGMGNYVAAEGPPNAFDGNYNNKFLSFGSCALNAALSSLTCGINTGFYVTLQRGAVVMKGLRFCTGNDAPPRDPITMTLEGSNQTGSALMLGSSWTLIYSGSCGLDVNPGRSSFGQTQTFSYNSIAYSSYRILITSKRSINFAVQYAEMELFGY